MRNKAELLLGSWVVLVGAACIALGRPSFMELGAVTGMIGVVMLLAA